jgi:hypothetical protein
MNAFIASIISDSHDVTLVPADRDVHATQTPMRVSGNSCAVIIRAAHILNITVRSIGKETCRVRERSGRSATITSKSCH